MNKKQRYEEENLLSFKCINQLKIFQIYGIYELQLIDH
jgi:hypothetical protein